MTNTERYDKILSLCLAAPVDSDNIKYELVGLNTLFNAHDKIECSNQEYIDNELDWYLSQDLNIKNHKGIENNPIWKACATDSGRVNSNYGWCVFSAENNKQFHHCIEALLEDRFTKHACMIYSRPVINDEWHDKVHARSDMICTIYVNYLLREGQLHSLVHMRSNDIWRGLRNDLAWQQYMLNLMSETLTSRGLDCIPGPIHWNADSLHLYERDVDKAVKYLNSKGYL